jgi:DNA-binding transcriptional ArsR family regulator
MSDTARTDLAAMRALSHPLRLELLDRLRTDGPATASLLAQRVGESSGATSYHLRQLARYGFVEDDARDAKGRERWWRHRERQLDLPRSPHETATTSALLGALLEREAAALDRYVVQRERLPEWEGASFFSSRVCHLTPARLAELNRSIQALTHRLVDGDDAPGARPVRVLAVAFPQPDPA